MDRVTNQLGPLVRRLGIDTKDSQLRYYWLLLAESHLTRRLFAGVLGKITALPVPAG